jgi:1-acyl-sn-glycerol-3-phosphate acyltransferase
MKNFFRLVLRLLFYKAIGCAVSTFVLDVRVTGRQRLPKAGPAILIANHNSHLDTLVLGALLPLSALRMLSPVAADHYFMSNRYLAWFATNVVGILPITGGNARGTKKSLQSCSEALRKGRILLFFPEGTRGEPEVPSRLKGGIAAIAEQYPDVPMIPVKLSGLGHSLPKGGTLPLPLACRVRIGNAIRWTGSRETYLRSISTELYSSDATFPTHAEV